MWDDAQPILAIKGRKKKKLLEKSKKKCSEIRTQCLPVLKIEIVFKERKTKKKEKIFV